MGHDSEKYVLGKTGGSNEISYEFHPNSQQTTSDQSKGEKDMPLNQQFLESQN